MRRYVNNEVVDNSPYIVNFVMNPSTGLGTGTIYDIGGRYTNLTVGYFWQTFPSCAYRTAGSEYDTNGNTLTESTSVVSNTATTTMTDSLGVTALTSIGTTVHPIGCPQTDYQPSVCINIGVYAIPSSFSYKDASNNNQSYSITYGSFYFATAFGCSNNEATGAGPFNLPTTVTFPDQTTLILGYEQTSGYSTNYTTGRITSLTLPTGGTITYAYAGTGNGGGKGINCSDGSPVLVTRTTSDGKWTYTHVAGTTGVQDSTTVTDPTGTYSATSDHSFTLAVRRQACRLAPPR